MKNNKIIFDFSLRQSTVVADRARHNIPSLDERGLRRIAKGRIFILFEKLRDYVCLETEVLDYLWQLKGMFRHIDAGNTETFAVSGDYFSNNIRFTYNNNGKTLEIYEANGGDFRILTSYRDLKMSFNQFYREVIDDFLNIYPELADNSAFQILSS